MKREKLLHEIMELDFALLDLRLYLNTHPCCSEGITKARHFLAESRAKTAQFEAQFGPLSNKSDIGENYFDWIDAPWPWQTENYHFTHTGGAR